MVALHGSPRCLNDLARFFRCPFQYGGSARPLPKQPGGTRASLGFSRCLSPRPGLGLFTAIRGVLPLRFCHLCLFAPSFGVLPSGFRGLGLFAPNFGVLPPRFRGLGLYAAVLRVLPQGFQPLRYRLGHLAAIRGVLPLCSCHLCPFAPSFGVLPVRLHGLGVFAAKLGVLPPGFCRASCTSNGGQPNGLAAINTTIFSSTAKLAFGQT